MFFINPMNEDFYSLESYGIIFLFGFLLNDGIYFSKTDAKSLFWNFNRPLKISDLLRSVFSLTAYVVSMVLFHALI